MSRARVCDVVLAGALALMVSSASRAATPAAYACGAGPSSAIDFTDADTTVGRGDEYDLASATTCPGSLFDGSGMGPDIVYALTPLRDATVTVHLFPDSVDLALYVLDICDNIVTVGCLGGSDSGASGGSETVTFHVENDETYHIVVDGYNGSQGTFSITVDGLISPLDVDANGAVDPLTDGLMILRHHFGFTGNVLIQGTVSANCNRCLASEIEDYLDDLQDVR